MPERRVHETDLGEICVVDSPFEGALSEEITSAFENESWKFGWGSNPSDSYRFWHLHIHITEDPVHCTSRVVSLAWSILSQGFLNGHSLLRTYGNAHVYGGEGYIHVDGKGADNYFSSVYFCHREWPAAFGGELVFFTKDASEIDFAVLPKPRRLVIFPGNIPHAVRPPSRSCSFLRMSLVFKTRQTAQQPLKS